MTAQYTVNFSEINKKDISVVGGKGANLGEMTNAGFPVPDGFCVTVASYKEFLNFNNFEVKINEIIKNVDVDDPIQLDDASKNIEKLISSGEIPKEIANGIIKAYLKLSSGIKHSLVAVRSSATAEDLPDASFAGQQATFLNVLGETNLLLSVKKCWASLFTARAIFYRNKNNIEQKNVGISVIVQKMVKSEASGVMFTIDPVTNDKDKIIIEAVWGLGEMIVQGSVVPDRYIVQKDTFSILSKEISDQDIMLDKVGNINKEIKVAKSKIEIQKISDTEIVKLAKIADDLQKHYYFPQDIEWAKEKNNLYIVQTRPVTTIKTTQRKLIKEHKDHNIVVSDTPIFSGISASPGIATGYVKILKSPKEIKKVTHGDVLVAEMTSPDYVPAMKKALAIVTDKGGQTSHAAIVSRELGIPCIVGTNQATKLLKDGQLITVNATSGSVYLGRKVKVEKNKEIEINEVTHKTATKLYVNLAEPDLAKKISNLNVDGVGLLRAEFMIADIGIHPKEAIKQKKQDKFIDKLQNGIEIFCKAFSPRPVIYRATDFKTNEYRSLTGGKNWEPLESNPMLGYRGAFRYISDPEVFTLELNAIKNVLKKYDNLHLMIPFVRSPEELMKIRKIVSNQGLFENRGFKFLMMVEIPSNVIQIDDFIDVGIDGVSIGSNDLTMLVTGTDRDNQDVAQAFDERSKAVLWSLRRTIKHCNKRGISSSICGQAPSFFDEIVEKLIEYGITSISVNPDAINRVRQVIYDNERKLGKR